jgi:imidazole glycerol-phosphate synthase subunit HisF
VVKGVQFVGLRDVGDPVALADALRGRGRRRDHLPRHLGVAEERATLLDVARRTAERLFIPLTIGGGVRSADDVARALRAGADKVSLNTAAVSRPEVLTELRSASGRSAWWPASTPSVVGGVDRCGWTHGGPRGNALEAVAWAQECVARGAGEILLTSIDRDGARTGYDLTLTERLPMRCTCR